MDSRTIIRLIQAEGWYRVGQKGSHVQFANDARTGRTTVVHPEKDVAPGTVRGIEKQSGVKLRGRE